MKPLKFFIDSHDQASQSFPAGLTPEQFAAFYRQYEAVCYEEGVVPVRTYIGYAEGRAFCINMAPDAEAVRRVHERVGLPYETITEVTAASPADTFLGRGVGQPVS